MAGDGTGDGELRHRVGTTPPAWRPGADHELAFASLDGRVEVVQTDSAKTLWQTVPSETPTQFVWSEDGERLLVLGERSLRAFDADGRKLWGIGLPIGPSGVAFVRKSHRFVMIRFSPATGRSELVLLQAEEDRGEERFLYSAPGRLRDARDVAQRQLAPRRLGQRRPVALPAPERRQGEGGLEHHRAIQHGAAEGAAMRRRSRKASAGAVPPSP